MHANNRRFIAYSCNWTFNPVYIERAKKINNNSIKITEPGLVEQFAALLEASTAKKEKELNTTSRRITPL